ncbi:MAG: hypothetical protein COY40_01730 [Alphaproteobacteria bacterium CG_4_10_14_0_8_um_filter_53_9]|nr:MAG: hypothetical protein COY40_01730 [Alphaproteobacteria bacterium CG_4_10_14_0_8_um_filter_53_9]
MIQQGINWASLLADNAAPYVTFFGMIVGALILGATPLGKPLKWAETFYHEFSHGMACLFTLGRPVRLQIQFNGAGTCWTRGGSRIIILLMGYMGASVWGAALYLIGWMLANVGHGDPTLWLRLEIILMLITVVWLVRDLKTLFILSTLIALYAATLYLPSVTPLPYILQFLGIYVQLNAIRAPLHLVDGRHVGDGAALADILWIPEGVWILFWFAFALAMLALCALLTLPGLAPALGFGM